MKYRMYSDPPLTKWSVSNMMLGPLHKVVLLLAAVFLTSSVFAQQDTSFDTECAASLLATAADEMTAKEIRDSCKTEHHLVAQDAGDLADAAKADGPPPEDALERKLDSDRRLVAEQFSILAHKPNYVLGAVYNFNGWDTAILDNGEAAQNYENDDVEAQFQVSIKVPLAIGWFGGRADLYTAYTNRSFWQAYNLDNSQPFRETNHEPEIWLQFSNDWNVLGFTNSVNAFGYVHQSNGQRGDLSRGWDRLFANFIFGKGDLVVSLKPWVWLNKNDDTSDNQDIDEYMGNGEIMVGYERNGNVFTAMLRNQIESGFDRGTVQLAWSFPLFDYSYLKGYVRYFNGYGESLIDYNNKVNSLGVGISITDWLK
jgi:phospholipase A1